MPTETGCDDRPVLASLRAKGVTPKKTRYHKRKTLVSLDLSANQFTQLPPEIGQLTALRVLDLEDNQVQQLPSEISRLKSLTELDLGGNRLAQIPPEIGQLKSLVELDLEDNQLAQLPPEIGQLTALQKVGLFSSTHFFCRAKEICWAECTDVDGALQFSCHGFYLQIRDSGSVSCLFSSTVSAVLGGVSRGQRRAVVVDYPAEPVSPRT